MRCLMALDLVSKLAKSAEIFNRSRQLIKPYTSEGKTWKHNEAYKESAHNVVEPKKYCMHDTRIHIDVYVYRKCWKDCRQWHRYFFSCNILVAFIFRILWFFLPKSLSTDRHFNCFEYAANAADQQQTSNWLTN